MNESNDKTSSMLSDFLLAQKEFGALHKDKTNPAFRSKYADLASCIDAVLAPLNANKFALIQKIHPADALQFSLETILLHVSGESLTSGVLTVPVDKNSPQGFGSAMTYVRRYTLMAVCGIAPEDDDGNAASPQNSKSYIPKSLPEPRKPPSITDDRFDEALKQITEGNFSIENLKTRFVLTSQQQKKLIQFLGEEHAPN